MILTHLAMFSFFDGASSIVITISPIEFTLIIPDTTFTLIIPDTDFTLIIDE